MFVDSEEGSLRVSRMMLAALLSSICVSIISYAHPYRQKDNFHLALLSNVTLAYFFSLGIFIWLCENNDNLCKKIISLSFNSYKTTFIAVVLIANMAAFTIFLICVVMFNTVHFSPICLAATSYRSNLEIPKSTYYHVFHSHVWKYGQGKYHTGVRQLQLHILGIMMWLDVDDLENIGMPGKSVVNCFIVIICYSEGYFE